MSPITANRTEPSFRGRVSVRVTGAWAAEASPKGAVGAGPESQPEDDEEAADHGVVHGSHLIARSGAAAGRKSTMSWAT